MILAAVLGATVIAGSVSAGGTDYGFWVAVGIFWVMGLLFRQRRLRVAELQAQAGCSRSRPSRPGGRSWRSGPGLPGSCTT